MTTAVPRRSRTGAVRRRAAAWLALLVFALNVLAPVLVNAPVRADIGAGMGAGIGSPADGRIVICTPSGLRVVGPDGEQRPLADAGGAEDGGAGGDIQFCAFCLPLVNAGLGALAAAEVAVPRPDGRRLAAAEPVTVEAAAPAARHRLPLARAPPVLGS